MDALLGSPIPILLAGLIVGSGLTVVYLNTRQRGLLIAMGVVLIVVVAGIILERSVKTDREKIAETLDQLASALEADGLEENSFENVFEAVDGMISRLAVETRKNARTNLKRAKITRVTYSNLRVEVNKHSRPPSATVRFDANVSGEGRPPYNEFVTYRTYPLEFVFKMVYDKDDRYDEPRWLIADPVGWRLKTFGQDADPERFGFDTGEMVEP